jgi:hypothetical protein
VSQLLWSVLHLWEKKPSTTISRADNETEWTQIHSSIFKGIKGSTQAMVGILVHFLSFPVTIIKYWVMYK